MRTNLYFWAKTLDNDEPGISVRDHCLNVGCVAQQLLTRLNYAFVDPSFTVWLASCHDIGKISPGFQKKCARWLVMNGLANAVQTKEWVAAESDHSKVSQYTLQNVLKNRFSASRSQAALWAAVAGMHHGRTHWRGQWKTSAPGIAQDDEWEVARSCLTEELAATLGPPGPPPSVGLDDFSTLWWTAGLITLSDWIGSDESHFPLARSAEPVSLESAQQRASAALDTIGFNNVSLMKGHTFQNLFGFPPNSLQEAALKVIQSPGVYVIEAPMGMGKTEASLAVAYQLISQGKATGLYFALPTQATSNRIHERVSSFLARVQATSPRLIHSGSWLVDNHIRFPAVNPAEDRTTAVPMRDWFASSKRALLAPFGVGTVDQALLGVIAAKHFFVRHFALAGKVLVLDEVHSYDIYTGTLIETLVRSLVKLRCTVIILSATLTRSRREQLLAGATQAPATLNISASGQNEPFPLITGLVNDQPMTSCPIASGPAKPAVLIRFGPEEDFLAQAVDAARAGACVLWICNTVDRATATFRAIKAQRYEGDPPVGLLHARFPFFRRQQLEEDWMTKLGKDRNRRPAGCVLVSTQIVEQSVDLDADLLVTELAPTDMLFQRLGRLWRHDIPGAQPRPRSIPEVWIPNECLTFEELASLQDRKPVCDALGKKAKVYAPYVLLRTLEHWICRKEVNLPGDIRSWLEATYAPRSEDSRPVWQQLLQELERQRKAHQGRAETIQNVWNIEALADEEGIATRLNECPTIPVVLATAIESNTLTLLNGQQIPVQANHFDYSTARALHRNIVKAPAWWFANKRAFLKSLPTALAGMVGLHVRGASELAVVRAGSIAADSLASDCQLTFDLESGLSRLQTTFTSTTNEDYDDESYD